MYNLKFQVSEEGVYTRYLQGISNLYVGDSSVIVKLNQINQTGLPEAQTGLFLDFNVRDSVEEEKIWQAFEHTLREVFNSVVKIDLIPNCQLKINIFILMAGFDIQSAIFNAVSSSLLKMSLPIKYSIFAMTDIDQRHANKKGNTIVVNLNCDTEIVYGICMNNFGEQKGQKISEFKSQLLRSLHESFRNSSFSN